MAWQAGHFNWRFIQSCFDPDEFDWWIAGYYELGLGGWGPAATVAAAAHNAGAMMAAAKGMQVEPRKPDDFRDNIGETAPDVTPVDVQDDEASIAAFFNKFRDRQCR